MDFPILIRQNLPLVKEKKYFLLIECCYHLI